MITEADFTLVPARAWWVICPCDAMHLVNTEADALAWAQRHLIEIHELPT